MRILLANDVVKQVNGLNSEKTLKRWTSLVKQYYGSNYFRVENIVFNREGNRRPVIVYTPDNIVRFQSVANILMKQPTNRRNLSLAIRCAFGSNVPIIRQKEKWEVEIEHIKNQLATVKKEDERLLRAIQEINRKLTHINSLLEKAQANKPKLFKD